VNLHAFRRCARIFLPLVFLLACRLAWSAPGDVIAKVLTAIPSDNSENVAVAIQSDGKVLAVGDAVLGTSRIAVTRYNADGSLDTTYGTSGTGTVLQPLEAGTFTAHDALLQPDGKLVVAGEQTSLDNVTRFGLARFNSDGTLDTSFSGGGIVMGIGSANSEAFALALQGDGKILVAGDVGNSSLAEYAVARLNANGTLDTSYGTNGVWTDNAGQFSALHGAILQPDGRLVVAGYSAAGAAPGSLRMVRLNTDGTKDGTWGTLGVVTNGNVMRANRMRLLGDGSVLVAAQTSPGQDFAVVKLTASGAPDASFGTNGIAGTTLTGQAMDLVVQSNGQVVAAGSALGAGSTFDAFYLVRFNADGTLDTSFGASGVQRTVVADGQTFTLGLAARPSGGFIAVGSAFSNAPLLDGITSTLDDSVTVAYTASGAVDTSFNGTGVSSLDLGGTSSMATGSALQADGKLVVAGTHPEVGPGIFGQDSFLVRYLADGTVDAGFGTNGRKLFVTSNTNAVVLQADGKIVTAGMNVVNHGGGNTTNGMSFSRFNADGTPDASFGSGGRVDLPTSNAEEWVMALALQPDGKLVGAGYLQNAAAREGYVVRLNADGTVDTAFGSNGFATVAMGPGANQIFAVALQPDGRIVVAGGGDVSGSQTSMMAARLNADGTLDTSFGSGGAVIVNFGTASSWAYGVAVQADGRIVLGGVAHPATNDDYALARLAANGSLDATFGTGGQVTTDFGHDQNGMHALAVLASGKIVGAGKDQGGTYGVVRYLADGSLDTAFGSAGHVVIPMNFNIGADQAYALSIATNGTMYVAGDASHTPGLAIVAGDPPGGGTGATPSVSLVSSANPSNAGQSVTFTASVTGSAGTATGTIDFQDGASAIAGCAAVALGSGSAACTTSALAAGSHSITAVYSGDASYAGATSNTVTQSVNSAPTTFTLTVGKAGSGTGTVTSSPGGINCGATCSADFASGTVVSLSAAADSGSTFMGWSGGGCSGAGACSVTVNAATTVTATFSAAADSPRLGALSTRMQVLTGDNVLIGGFIIGGSTPKTVVVRARGPSLASSGISNFLANPQLQLVFGDGSVIANDDWGNAANAADIQASGFAPSDPHESAILVTLQPGPYTAIVSGVGGTTGVGIVEVFEVDHPENPLAGISTRGEVLTGNDVMIGGLIIQGNAPQTVVLRARGPSLASQGVANPLQNPVLQLVASDGTTITNDDWGSAPNAAQIQASGFAPSDPHESAILVTLQPGAYTAIVSGAGGSTGVGIVEVFPAQ
jgi:uncharacterized delta-60 repeat protein